MKLQTISRKFNFSYVFKYLLIALLIFLSFFPRSVEILNKNPVFGFDQGREIIAARDIVENLKPILIGTELGAGSAGVNGLFHGPVYYYMLTLPYILFNGDPVGGNYLMFLFGLAAILFGYFLGRKMFDFWGGILFSLFIALSPLLTAQSRFLWSPHMVTFFILLCFYFIYKIDKKKKLYIFLSAFSAAFLYNFEFAIAVPIVISLFLYCLYLFKKDLRSYIYLLLGFFIGFLPMVIFEVRHNFLGFNGLAKYFFSPKSSNLELGKLLHERVSVFMNNFIDTFTEINVPTFLMYFFVVIFACLFFYFMKREKDLKIKRFFYFLILSFVMSVGVFFILKSSVYQYYLIHLALSYIITASYIFIRSYQKNKTVFYLLSFLIAIIFIFGTINAFKVSVKDYSDYGSTAKLKGKIDAIDFIYKDAMNNRDFGLLVFTPPVYTYPYDYLIRWYGEKKYKYIPYQEKKGTFYLLIEPDYDKPWSYEGWLKTVIKEGRVVKEVKLPSGFIIQKREIL